MKLKSLCIVLMFAACSTPPQKESKSQFNKEAQQISAKYSANFSWDSTQILSYKLQDEFIKSKERMTFKGTINDLIQKDSTYVLKVFHKKTPVSFAMINLTEQQFKSIKENNRKDLGAFVINVNKISYSGLSVEAESESDEDGTDYSYHIGDGGGEGVLIFKGSLIDYCMRQ